MKPYDNVPRAFQWMIFLDRVKDFIQKVKRLHGAKTACVMAWPL